MGVYSGERVGEETDDEQELEIEGFLLQQENLLEAVFLKKVGLEEGLVA